MFKPFHRLLVVVAAAGLLAGCSAGPSSSNFPTADNNPPQPVPVLKTVCGQQSGVKAFTFDLITSADALARTGLKSSIINKLNVNFDRQSVVLVALGQKNTGGYWVQVQSASLVGNKLFVQGLTNTPGKHAMVSQQRTQPFCAVVVPRTDATELGSDIQTVHDQPMPSMKK